MSLTLEQKAIDESFRDLTHGLSDSEAGVLLSEADRIPRRLFGGDRPWVGASLLHPDSIKARDCREGEVVVSVDGHFRWMHRDALARLGVALLCVLLSGCQFIAYQHFDYRQQAAPSTPAPAPAPAPAPKSVVRHDAKPCVARLGQGSHAFPGMFGLSPGLSALADAWSSSGNGIVWTGHSAGGQRIASLLNSPPYGPNSPPYGPDTVVLVEPWPLRLDLSAATGVKRVVVVSARPCEVVPPPGVTVEYRRRPLAMLPVDLTVGHLVACGWSEAMP